MTPRISEYNYVASATGNAIYSGLSFEEFWWCMLEAKNPAELDAGVSAGIWLKQIISKG